VISMSAPVGAWAKAKRAIRTRLIAPASRSFNSLQIGRAVRQLRLGATPDAGLLGRLRSAWGNGGFAADVEYLLKMAAEVEHSVGPVLECGTGVSTLIAALLAARRGRDVWCLEQNPDWFGRMRRILIDYRIYNVRLLHAPLRSYGDDYAWYDVAPLQLPASFDLAICDGPFIDRHWGAAFEQWRYGLLPVLQAAGVRLGKVLLDDANEPRAQAVFERWEREGRARVVENDGGAALALPRQTLTPDFAPTK